MSQEKKAKVKNAKNKKKMDTATIIIIVGLIIIAIPFLVLAWILFSDSTKTGTPITGDRFNNDLNPAITESQLKEVESSLDQISGIDSTDTVLKTATLRVYLDTEDSMNTEEVQKIAEEAYTKVTAILDTETYFSQHDNQKMYDLEIHVYNLSENRDEETFSYVIVNKSSSMENYLVQVVSEPKDPELAQQLLDELEQKNNPTPTPEAGDITVGGQDQELTEDEAEQGGEE